MKKWVAVWCGAALLAMVSLSVQAFVLGGTRVVLPEGTSVSLPVLSGKGDGVLLIRSRLSAGADGQGQVPGVVISPPLFRLDKGERGVVRLSAGALPGLPRDRESIFYLSVAGLPSTNPLSPARQGVASGMVVATGALIKVFYRPKSMVGNAANLGKSLTASRVPAGVEVVNPTPYHVNISALDVDGHPVVFSATQPSMLPPFSRQVYITASVQKKELKWAVLNDLGGREIGTTVVQ